jgi:hypothetical protein
MSKPGKGKPAVTETEVKEDKIEWTDPDSGISYEIKLVDGDTKFESSADEEFILEGNLLAAAPGEGTEDDSLEALLTEYYVETVAVPETDSFII